MEVIAGRVPRPQIGKNLKNHLRIGVRWGSGEGDTKLLLVIRNKQQKVQVDNAFQWGHLRNSHSRSKGLLDTLVAPLAKETACEQEKSISHSTHREERDNIHLLCWDMSLISLDQDCIMARPGGEEVCQREARVSNLPSSYCSVFLWTCKFSLTAVGHSLGFSNTLQGSPTPIYTQKLG